MFKVIEIAMHSLQQLYGLIMLGDSATAVFDPPDGKQHGAVEMNTTRGLIGDHVRHKQVPGHGHLINLVE